MELNYDHIGIPITYKKEGMVYYPDFKVWTSEYDKTQFRIEWIYFEEGNNFHPLVQTQAHVCFKVKDINAAILGKNVIVPVIFDQTYYMAFIEEDGAPIEFIQTLRPDLKYI